MLKITFVSIAIALASLTSVASLAVPASVINQCTATPKIYNQSTIKVDKALNKQAIHGAVLDALSGGRSEPEFVVNQFTGQWFYEYADDDAIYAGFKVRSHYLKVAIIPYKNSFETIICDSTNLKQSKRSIHRKAPLWKDQLDTKIKLAVAQSAMANKRNPHNSGMQELMLLKKYGHVTDEEYNRIKARIETKS